MKSIEDLAKEALNELGFLTDDTFLVHENCLNVSVLNDSVTLDNLEKAKIALNAETVTVWSASESGKYVLVFELSND